MKINSEKLENLWNSDEVRILILGSLTIQIALIFLAPLRKRITNIMVTLTLWLLYLTADNVATLGLGNISHQTPAGSVVSSELTVLWAPFLLVHLGGPDTITSYSIEDNELWWRHLLGLLFQVIITVYIFIQSPPTGSLWIPTIFVFIPGLIKFAERTHALRLASKDNIKDTIISELRPGNSALEIELTVSKDNTPSNTGRANETTIVSRQSTPSTAGQANETTKGFWVLMGSIKSVLFPPEGTIDILVSSFKDISKDESALILEGFIWFNIFKRLLVDVTFSADLLMKSQDRFSDLSTTVALDLVSIELSFLYDYLHTKAVHMHSILGRALRYFSLVSFITALVVFHHLDKEKYVSGDIIITYILFGVGLSLEVIATILLVFSDWTVVALKRTKHSQCVANCITALVKRITLNKGIPRWARTIGHFNLVDVCLRDRDTVLAKIMRILKIKNKWDNMRESKLNPLLPGLEEIMVTEAKRRALNVHIYKMLVQARSYRGYKTLERHNQLERLEWSIKREFDESIFLWHLATDICYYEDETSNKPNGEKQEPSSQPNGENQEPSHQPNGENPDICYYENFTPNQSNRNGSDDTSENNDNEREVSWKTSNYMVYLLTQQPSMVLLGYGKTRFELTCAYVKNIVKKKFKDKGKLKGKEARKELVRYGKFKWTPPVLGQNNASVPADGSQPTNKMGTSVLKKIWANLRRWGTSVLKNWAVLVREQTNAPVPDDGRQPGWRCWGKRKGKEDKGENQEAPPVAEQNEEVAPVPEQTNAPLPDDGGQHGWRCWGKRKGKENMHKNEETKSKDDSGQHGWRFRGKRTSKDEKAKLKDQEDMGMVVIKDSLRLAEQLQGLKPEIKWKLISETWMEMLGYAAIHCDSYQHAKSLSRGGELLTHLWLLMSQLGVVEEDKMQQFQPGSV